MATIKMGRKGRWSSEIASLRERLKRIEEAAALVIEVEGDATPHHRALAKALRTTHPKGPR